MFFLISDSCIPLHRLNVLRIAYLESDNKSYVNACNQDQHFSKTVQYSKDLLKVNVSIQHFKKSEQWVGLQRRHAQLIANENAISKQFEQSRIKFADEHYIPTVLSTYHLSKETTCSAGITYTDWHWWRKPSHPKVSIIWFFVYHCDV